MSSVIERENQDQERFEELQECGFHSHSDNKIRNMPSEAGIPVILFPPTDPGRCAKAPPPHFYFLYFPFRNCVRTKDAF